MSDLNDRRPAEDSEPEEKDSYELAYEQQLKRFSEPDSEEFTQAVPVRNISGRNYDEHPNRSRRSGERSGERSKKKKGRGKKDMKRSQTAHIDRSEPLRFGGSHGGEAAKKKHSVLGRVLLILFILILLAVLFVNIMIIRYLSKVTYRETGKRSFTTASLHSDNVQNILLIGSDAREEGERGRTDSIILLSIDSKKDRTTMTSFMRDCYVTLPEYDLDGDGACYGEGDRCKLNAAYVYGGAELLMDTIEYNFDVAVDRYIYIDFYSFIDIVDSVGGIELDITDEEAIGMKAPMYEQNKYLGNPQGTDYLSCGGNGIMVNGNQALGYARLRYVGNADFKRTERQRTVINRLLKKAGTLSIFGKDKFASAVASNIETNLSKWELYKLIIRSPWILKYETKELRIPEDDEFGFGTAADKSSVLMINFTSCIETLNREIYE